jgi:predicted RNA-binding Zn-ribbon protein involved in translation (DUF1610 family)
MKVIKKKVTDVELTCPYCDEIIPEPGGPLTWQVVQLPPSGTLITCPSCGKSAKAPRS